MSKENDGGPVIGRPFVLGDVGSGKTGISVRTWLAGLAMQGMLASDVKDEALPHHVADSAVLYADELLKALEK